MNKQVFLENNSVLYNNGVVSPPGDVNTDNSLESVINIFNYEDFKSKYPIPHN